jgi:DNA-binding transcriptional ArsR family regulator
MRQALQKVWKRAIQSDDAMAQVVRDVGRALASLDDDHLAEVRDFLATAPVDHPFRQGMVAGLVETIDGHRAARRKHDAAATAAAQLDGGVRGQLLVALAAAGRATPSALSERLGKGRPDVSRALAKLGELGLVEAPQRGVLDGREAWYRLSLAGEAVVEAHQARAAAAAAVDAAHESPEPARPRRRS